MSETIYYDRVVKLKQDSDGWWVSRLSSYPTIWKMVSGSVLESISAKKVIDFIKEDNDDSDNMLDGSRLILKYDKGEWFAKGPNEQDCNWKPVCDCDDDGKIDTESVYDLMEDIYTTMQGS